VAEADYDCRPPGVRPTASEPKANRFFAASASPDPLAYACSLARTGIQRPRIQPGWRLCNPIASAPVSARAKNAVQHFVCRFAPAARRELKRSNWIIGFGARAVFWPTATVQPACCPTGPILSPALSCSPLGGRRNGRSPPRCCLCRAAGENPNPVRSRSRVQVRPLFRDGRS
jgi:hypothetical protein